MTTIEYIETRIFNQGLKGDVVLAKVCAALAVKVDQLEERIAQLESEKR